MKAYFCNNRLLSDEGKKISLERKDRPAFGVFKLILYFFAHLPSSYKLRIAENEYYIGPSWRGTSLKRGGVELAYITGDDVDDVKIAASTIPGVIARSNNEDSFSEEIAIEMEEIVVCNIKVFSGFFRSKVELDYKDDIENDVLALSAAVALRLMYC